MSTRASPRPAQTTFNAVSWALSDGLYENHFFSETPEAAVWLVDEAMRAHRQGQIPNLTVHRCDPFLGVLWDASSDVAAVFTATGWPTLTGDILTTRTTVIRILTDILITDETPVDAPFPGISDPHTYALVCR